MIIKGGMIAAAPMGDINASIPTPQPVHYRPMFGAHARGVHQTCITFLSQAAIARGIAEKLGLNKLISPVQGTRTITKADMKHNTYTPVMEVDPEIYEVRADGVHLTCAPAQSLPMAQLYFLF